MIPSLSQVVWIPIVGVVFLLLLVYTLVAAKVWQWLLKGRHEEDFTDIDEELDAEWLAAERRKFLLIIGNSSRSIH